MSNRLILLQDGQAKTFELKSTDLFIGRLPECEVQLASNMVSRKHARVYLEGGNHYVEDLGSGNGTFVNGQKIVKPHKLKTNDRLKFGPVLLRFESDTPGSGSHAVSRALDQASRMTAVEISDDQERPTSTILGSLDSAAGFSLDVRPQEKLKAVLEISRALAGTVEVEKLLPRILDSLFQIFPAADRGCILLKDPRTGEMITRAMKHRREGEDASVKLSRTIVNSVLNQKKAVLSADAASDARFDASESISSLTIRSMMCVPMLDLQGEPIGIINIDTQNPLTQFRNDDLDIMMTVAGQAALTYETAKLLQSYAQKQKQDNEMNIARNVQHALLPEHLPEVHGYQFFASYDSAQAVGGDYYDVIPTKDGRIWLAFGDVAGKGVPASLVMSRMSSVVRSVSEFVTDASEAVARINDHMCAKAVEGRFVTFVLIILDLHQHKMSIVNAGHMAPMVRKPDGGIVEVGEEAVGVPIGVIEGFTFDTVEADIAVGETVVIYTDGVSEAMNAKNDLYGMERLRTFVGKGPIPPSELGVAIREDVRKFANGWEQNDDITLMVFGRTA
ncbi:SpoIIE family protein phosphatase [Planctomicrobium piriforme]|uniref:Serine phosphatase RsbU, regulator of sigma subunit n=1 Tax=Planctomicrobium piriforme TaxID=1576369 RepID=A0A1I3G8P2_9PLAN|nr:SpoIIE family protein phosphatase [Planctomicrobium piriforme]SFI19905.1 Serine phosphatase RsbU, regulator of sigma subunit [Planctomicrobium piriforme]